MLAIAQFFSRDGEDLVFDDIGWPAIVGHLYASDRGLAAGIHLHILRAAEQRINRDAAERHCRRQGGNLEFECLNRLGAGCIHGMHRDRIAAGRQVSRVEGEVKAVAPDERTEIRLDAQADDRRLALDGDAAGGDVADQGFGCQPFNFEARRQLLDFETLLNCSDLPARVGGADAELVFLGQQLEGIQIEFIRRFGIGFDHFAVNDELDLRDLGLPAGIHRDDFGLGDIFLGRGLKIVRNGRGQGGDLKLSAQPAHVAFDIADGDI